MSIYGDPIVGNLGAFLLGLPFGALGGYFYRGWHDEHPGKWIPGIGSDYNVGGAYPNDGSNAAYVGGPWVDLVGPNVGAAAPYRGAVNPYVGGPWVDLVGPNVGGPWVDLVGPNVGAANPYVGGPWVDLVGPNVGAANPYVGGPWVDLVGPYVGCSYPGGDNASQVGGPWVDLVGPYVGQGVDIVGADGRRSAWLQTRALIESAKREASQAQASAPAAAWVWSLDPTGLPPGTGANLTTSQLIPFASPEQAQAYMLERIHTPHVALALFDTTAVRHWPNPVRWTKNTDPVYEPLIAQRAAQFSPDRVSGDSAYPQMTAIGSALSDVRARAQTLANKRSGNVVGVIHTSRDNLWHALAFRNVDDADEWLETQDQPAYTYAAYFDKNGEAWPSAVIEKIGGFRSPKISSAVVGASLDDTRVYAKSLASAKRGNAAGVVRTEDGAWFTYAFPNLDAAIDWLSGMTAFRKNFSYAAAFEKGPDGTAYIQQEEFGVHPMPLTHRALAAASGEQNW